MRAEGYCKVIGNHNDWQYKEYASTINSQSVRHYGHCMAIKSGWIHSWLNRSETEIASLITMNDSSMSGYAAIVICSISAAIKLLMLYIMLSFLVKFERKHLKNAA